MRTHGLKCFAHPPGAIIVREIDTLHPLKGGLLTMAEAEKELTIREEYGDVDQTELDEAFAALKRERKRKETAKKYRAKSWSELTDEEKAKRTLATKKRSIRQKLILIKAAEAGITVSDEEIEAEMS